MDTLPVPAGGVRRGHARPGGGPALAGPAPQGLRAPLPAKPASGKPTMPRPGVIVQRRHPQPVRLALRDIDAGEVDVPVPDGERRDILGPRTAMWYDDGVQGTGLAQDIEHEI